MASPILAIFQRWNILSNTRNLFGPSLRRLHTPTVKEVRIPSGCGELAGKWWGDDSRQPILALHGWQDNAGTWDMLVPRLPSDYSVLAIDLPGHGRSSWIPKGMIYNPWLYVRCIQDIMHHYKWDTVSFLGHSMGSIIAYRYATVFPETVNFYIAVENIIPDFTTETSMEKSYKNIGKSLQNLYVDESRLDSEPPSYLYEEVLVKWHLGTRKSVALETARYLVDRGTAKSKSDPTKYYFCRDPRLKNNAFSPPHPEFTKHGITRLQFPLLYIKGEDSHFATDDLAVTCRDLLAQTNSQYEFHCLPGTHHVHLNNANVVAPIVTEFLNKYATSGAQESLIATNCKL